MSMYYLYSKKNRKLKPGKKTVTGTCPCLLLSSRSRRGWEGLPSVSFPPATKLQSTRLVIIYDASSMFSMCSRSKLLNSLKLHKNLKKTNSW